MWLPGVSPWKIACSFTLNIRKRSRNVRIREIQRILKMEVSAGEKGLDREASGGYCGDLLSDAMANAPRGGIWLTVQSHQNIVAVAVLRELAGIVLVNGRKPDQDTIQKAEEESIPLLLSPVSSFVLAGRMYELGVGKEPD
jgi:predicted transcriptional regulator